MSGARDHALARLDALALPAWPPGVMPKTARRAAWAAPEDPRDRALAEHLYVGVIKNLLHLQYLLSRLADRNLRSIDPLVQKITVLGLYQLRFLTRIGPWAAVDEAVEQAKRLGRRRAAGFVNAVLRKAVHAQAIPLPDRAAQPQLYARDVLSHPQQLFRRLVALVGVEHALRLCERNNREPPTIVRLNAGVPPQALERPEIRVTPHEQPGMFVVEPAPAALLADWAARGIAQAQDPTAALVVEAMELLPGQVVLDRCCGAGTKTLQIVEKVGPTGLVVAMDPCGARCEMLSKVLRDRGIHNVRVRQAGMIDRLDPADPRVYDRILVDAPCSNSGVLARRPEARYAQSDRTIVSLTRLQDRILDDAARALARGGRLVYSTCSLWPRENRQRIDALLGGHGDFRLLEQHAQLPSLDAAATCYRDGGYYAVLARDR